MATIVKTFTVASRGIGLPDYSQPKPVGQVPVGPIHTLSDMGELAARLGSPITHDRRGDVIWIENFEGQFDSGRWQKSGTGDYTIEQSAITSRNGTFSCRLLTDTDEDDYCRLLRYSPYPVLGHIGLELSFTLPLNFKYIQIEMHLYDETNIIAARIRYHLQDKKIEFVNSDNAWADLATEVNLLSHNTLSLWHTMKLVADFDNRQYTRFILDSTEYDMSDFGINAASNTTYAHLLTYIYAYNYSATAPVYIDDVICTQNEPKKTI